MQRPLLKSQQHAPQFSAAAEGAVSLISVRAIPRGTRNWLVKLKIEGAHIQSKRGDTALNPDLTPHNFHLERLDGGANLAFQIKNVEWIQAPTELQLHLFMDARNSELNDQHLYQHVIKLVSYPDQDVNPIADRLPLFLLPSRPRNQNAYGMQEVKPSPIIDYTAKDFDVIRQLMITNIQRLLPKWRDETAADIGTMLLEILAYVADYLSYRQDFAASEAYLHTAQLRTSIMRHARLLGYFPNEGCTQRTVLTFQVSEELEIPSGFSVLSAHDNEHKTLVTKNSDLFNRMIAGGSACYETRHNLTAVPALNSLRIHDYGLAEYTLFAGTTAAILEMPKHSKKDTNALVSGSLIVFHQTTEMAAHQRQNHNGLLRAHAVRLTHVEHLKRGSHSTGHKNLIRVRWNTSDALPRDLPVTMKLGRRENTHKSVAIVFANAVEAEYGLTRTIKIPRPKEIQASDWRPTIEAQPLMSAPISVTAQSSVNAFLDPNSNLLTYPTIRLEEEPFATENVPALNNSWQPTRDLLRHGASSRVFMIDSNENGTVTLRFGKHGMGLTPSLGCHFKAHVREAVGSGGSIGTNVLTVAAPEGPQFNEFASSLLNVNNPLPGTAPRQPESSAAIRHKASESIRKSNICATLTDYEDFATRVKTVKAARAWLVGGEPWPYIHVAILAKHANVVDDIFVEEIKAYLDNHRPIGRRLIVSGPTPIPIEIVLSITADPVYAKIALEREILSAIGNTESASKTSYFSSNNVDFGQRIYPNDIISSIATIAGIEMVRLVAFKRKDKDGPLVAEVLAFENGEVPMLESIVDDPAGGRISVRFEKEAHA